MFYRNLLLLSGLAAIAVSEPVPQFDDPFSDLSDPFSDLGDPFSDLGNIFSSLNDELTGLGTIPTFTGFGDSSPSFTGFGDSSPSSTGFGAVPTFGGATRTQGGDSFPTDNPFAGMPTLPASIQSVLVTAAPTNALADPCALTASPSWLNALPTDVKSGIASYENALQSWLSANSAKLGTMTNLAGVCTKGSGNGGPVSNAAPRPTGALGASIAGAVGLLGVMAAL